MRTKERMEALASVLMESIEDIDQIDEESNIFGYGSEEYLVLTDEEAQEAATEYIKDSLWAFNPNFLTNITGMPIEVFTVLSEKYEDGNDAVLKLVEMTCGLDKLVKEAVLSDGRGHFLAQYDGAEGEAKINSTYYYIYRQN